MTTSFTQLHHAMGHDQITCSSEDPTLCGHAEKVFFANAADETRLERALTSFKQNDCNGTSF